MYSFAEFYDMLDAHDWYYQFSDDHRSWLAGQNQMMRIKETIKRQPELAPLFQQFKNHYDPAGPKAEKPPRPI